jgi:DNA modification methylase
VAGQLGLEPTPEAYVCRVVEVFREVRRVLRPDGTLWLNIGDSYASGEVGRHDQKSGEWMTGSAAVKGCGERRQYFRPSGLKAKDLVGIPWRLAFALQADGWYLRSDIIWHKPNPMPESVRDRPTKAHEYVFLLSKSQRYFWDAEAVREEAKYGRCGWDSQPYKCGDIARGHGGKGNNRNGCDPSAGRNIRSVWTITPKPFKGAHFATFPPALVERCVKAGSKPGDTVLDPFIGSGTTAVVAKSLGRDCIGIDLQPKYLTMARARIKAGQARVA